MNTTNEYDLFRKYDRFIFCLRVTRDAGVVALVIFAVMWLVL